MHKRKQGGDDGLTEEDIVVRHQSIAVDVDMDQATDTSSTNDDMDNDTGKTTNLVLRAQEVRDHELLMVAY